MINGKKVTILGAGNVGATIAYTLSVSGTASEIVLNDINHEKAKGEAMDIIQGMPFCPTVDIYAGELSATKNSDIVIVTVGMARKPGMTRIDLAQNNVDIIKSLMPKVLEYSPEAKYIMVSNPVDILTYAFIKCCDVPVEHVIGSGTLLDTARLRSALADHVELNPKNIHAYVFGEHGDTSLIPWSLTTIAGMEMGKYCEYICNMHNNCGKTDLSGIENDVRTAGAKIIASKGATYYAIALAVRHICEALFTNSESVMTVSSLLTGEYDISDVCLSIPFIVNAKGISRSLPPPLNEKELAMLINSANALKNVISSIKF